MQRNTNHRGGKAMRIFILGIILLTAAAARTAIQEEVEPDEPMNRTIIRKIINRTNESDTDFLSHGRFEVRWLSNELMKCWEEKEDLELNLKAARENRERIRRQP